MRYVDFRAIVISTEEVVNSNLDLVRDLIKDSNAIGHTVNNGDFYILYEGAREQMEGFQAFKKYFDTVLVSKPVRVNAEEVTYWRRFNGKDKQ